MSLWLVCHSGMYGSDHMRNKWGSRIRAGIRAYNSGAAIQRRSTVGVENEANPLYDSEGALAMNRDDALLIAASYDVRRPTFAETAAELRAIAATCHARALKLARGASPNGEALEEMTGALDESRRLIRAADCLEREDRSGRY